MRAYRGRQVGGPGRALRQGRGGVHLGACSRGRLRLRCRNNSRSPRWRFWCWRFATSVCRAPTLTVASLHGGTPHAPAQVVLVFSNQGMGNLANALVLIIAMAIFGQTGSTLTHAGSRQVLTLMYGFGAVACVVMVVYRCAERRPSALLELPVGRGAARQPWPTWAPTSRPRAPACPSRRAQMQGTALTRLSPTLTAMRARAPPRALYLHESKMFTEVQHIEGAIGEADARHKLHALRRVRRASRACAVHAACGWGPTPGTSSTRSAG